MVQPCRADEYHGALVGIVAPINDRAYRMILCVVFFFASVKLAKREPTGMDRPWRQRHPTAAMVPRSRRDRTRRLALTISDKTMSLK